MEYKVNIPDNNFFGTNYQIIKFLGEGTIGKCFLVTDKNDNKKKVIKVYKNEEAWENISEKSNILLNVNHSNIEKVYSIEVLNGVPCAILEYMDGNSIDKLIKSKSIKFYTCMCVLEKILCAIKYLQESGVSHKDIKPSNIFISSDNNTVKLVDIDFLAIDSTNKNRFAGTIKYSAPERIREYIVTEKTELYSLGLVICEMIIGKLPFEPNLRLVHSNLENIFSKILETKKSEFKGIYKEFFDTILKFIKFDYEERITISEAFDDVTKIKKLITSNPSIKYDSLGNYAGIANFGEFNYYSDMTAYNGTWLIDNTPTALSDIGNLESSSCKANTYNGDITIVTDNPVSEKHRILNSMRKPVRNTLLSKENKGRTTFHRQLQSEYDILLKQAKITFYLWMVAVIISFAMIIYSVCLITMGLYPQGIFVALLDAYVVAIQKLFSVREDHYIKLIENKMQHLEKGDYFEYFFDRISDGKDSAKQADKIMNLIKWINNSTK